MRSSMCQRHSHSQGQCHSHDPKAAHKPAQHDPKQAAPAQHNQSPQHNPKPLHSPSQHKQSPQHDPKPLHGPSQGKLTRNALIRPKDMARQVARRERKNKKVKRMRREAKGRNAKLKNKSVRQVEALQRMIFVGKWRPCSAGSMTPCVRELAIARKEEQKKKNSPSKITPNKYADQTKHALRRISFQATYSTPPLTSGKLDHHHPYS